MLDFWHHIFFVCVIYIFSMCVSMWDIHICTYSIYIYISSYIFRSSGFRWHSGSSGTTTAFSTTVTKVFFIFIFYYWQIWTGKPFYSHYNSYWTSRGSNLHRWKRCSKKPRTSPLCYLAGTYIYDTMTTFSRTVTKVFMILPSVQHWRRYLWYTEQSWQA